MELQPFEIILFVTGKALKVHMTIWSFSEYNARAYALRKHMYNGKMQGEVKLDGYGIPMFSGLEVKAVS